MSCDLMTGSRPSTILFLWVIDSQMICSSLERGKCDVVRKSSKGDPSKVFDGWSCNLIGWPTVRDVISVVIDSQNVLLSLAAGQNWDVVGQRSDDLMDRVSDRPRFQFVVCTLGARSASAKPALRRPSRSADRCCLRP